MANKYAIHYSPSEKRRLVQAIRAAAIAQAELWDVLRDIESERRCSIEYDIYLLDSLAGDCSAPPSFSDLPVAAILGFIQAALESDALEGDMPLPAVGDETWQPLKHRSILGKRDSTISFSP
jgi:hypothetical protein